MAFRSLFLSLSLICMLSPAGASTSKEQYDIETREAADRYAEDMAICKEESDRKKRSKCSKVAKDAKMKSLGEAMERKNKAKKA